MVIVVLVLGILAVGAYFLVGSGLFFDAPAAASMTLNGMVILVTVLYAVLGVLLLMLFGGSVTSWETR